MQTSARSKINIRSHAHMGPWFLFKLPTNTNIYHIFEMPHANNPNVNVLSTLSFYLSYINSSWSHCFAFVCVCMFNIPMPLHISLTRKILNAFRTYNIHRNAIGIAVIPVFLFNHFSLLLLLSFHFEQCTPAPSHSAFDEEF